MLRVHTGVLFVFAVALALAAPARAGQTAEPTRAELVDMARQMVARIGTKLKAIDRDEKKNAGEIDFANYPDGEKLLFLPRAGSFTYSADIQAVKNGNMLFLSVEDLIAVLGLAVDYDPAKKRGTGWYLREDWPVSFDFNDKTVFSRNRNFAMREEDILVVDNHYYVAQRALAEWLDMNFKFDIAQQYVEVLTPYPLPEVARNYRLSRKNYGSGVGNIAQLPRKPTKYSWLDLNTADVRLQSRYSRQSDSEANYNQRADVGVEGQVLKHHGFAYATSDNRDGLTSVTARLSREEEDPVLLGRLKARSYTIGDTDTTDIPLTGDTGQELGMRVTNNPLANADFQSTDISGDALPGWDVELYRSGVLIDSILVGGDARYEFPDVQLFAGDNEFEVFFYGPQGEIRSDSLNIPVTEAFLATQKDVYDVSMSFADTHLYRRPDSNDPDENTPHIAARYSTYVGDSLIYAGFRNRSVDDDNKAIAAAGLTKIIAGTVLDANFGVDGQADSAAQFGARRNLKGWQLGTTAAFQTDGYSPQGEDDPAVMRLTASANRPYKPLIGTAANISLNAGYSESAAGNILQDTSLLLGQQFGRINLSNVLMHQKSSVGFVDGDERLDDTVAVRANLGEIFLRGGINFDIKPEQKVDQYFSQISYRPRSNLTSELEIEHDPDQNLTEGRATVNYTHEKFRASPFVEYDTNNDLFAGLNINFSAIKKPNALIPQLTSSRVLGRGLVSSFVFHDKNGNAVFDNDDEPLPDVVVESLNIRRRTQTDEGGYALIDDLPNTRATDIHIDQSTLPDPFMISGFEGVSIFPSAGEIVELQFPVLMGGEVDGTATLNGSPIKAGVRLIAIGGHAARERTINSEGDGFFLFTQVPPGQYIMTVSDDSARALKAAVRTPRIIEIGTDGTALYGQNLGMVSGRNVPIILQVVENGIRPDTPVYVLKVREGASEGGLLPLLRRIATLKAPAQLYAGLERLDVAGEDEPDVKFYHAPGNALGESHRRCRALMEEGISCDLIVLLRPTAPLPASPPLKTASR